MRMGLDRKILGGFIICCLVLGVVTFVSFRNRNQFVEAFQWVNHTHAVLYECEQIMVNVVESETGTRGFVITGNEEFLQPYIKSKAELSGHIDKFQKLTNDNLDQQRNIAALSELIRQHDEQLDKSISLKKQGADSETTNASIAQSRRILNELRSAIGKMNDQEERLLDARLQSSDRELGNFTVIFSLLIVVIVVVLLAVYFLIMSNLKEIRKLGKEADDKNWLLTGTEGLVKGIQGNKTLPELGHDVLRHMAGYLDIQLGSFYVTGSDNNSLRLEATFAVSKEVVKKDIMFGEGFVGQVALENRMTLLSDMDDERYVIDSTFGSIKPRHILAIPFTFEKSVIGVIELGSLSEFTEPQKQYLNVVEASIAIAVISSTVRNVTKELLEETQRQAEELETQQEELKQYNEELHAKTEMLERSETELRAQQAELELINVDLEEKGSILSQQKQALEQSKREIEVKAKEVELSSRYKSEFLSNMSHELRTPLNSILILAQLLSENKNNNLGTKEVDYAKNINASGTGLLNLINEILDLSKIEAGKMELDIETFQVREPVHTVYQMLEGIALSKGVVLESKVDKEVAEMAMTSDRQRIEQILRNLLSNALKFTPVKGTVTLTVGKLKKDVSIANVNLRDRNSAVFFSVHDTGIGIAQDKRELVFQAFQQADGSTKRKYGGTGLGLSISRELAHALGGEIQLESREGEGSTFTLILPATYDGALAGEIGKSFEVKKKESIQPIVVHSPPPSSNGIAIDESSSAKDDRSSIRDNDKVVLIIEDDEKFAEILLSFIKDRGYKGVIAKQGNTGISYARHYKPIAILLDMNLPVMDGHEVMRLVKNDPELRHIPVQIISAYDKKKESMSLGAFDYLNKPVSVAELHKAFDRITAFTNKKLKKLLVVEDDQLQNHAIRELIDSEDIRTASAHTGEEALNMLEKEAYDCMIIDLGLPQMSGFDLMEKIRSSEKLSRTPIIVYTGRDLKKEDTVRLTRLADTVVLKTANSQERLLDETILFLHRVESQLPKDKQLLIRKFHNKDDVLKNKRVLIVDDDIRNIYSLSNALEEEGISCLTAENGKVAIETLHHIHDIDLVLMDVMMPEMDGYEATQEIRKMLKFKKLPIIALTAKAMKGDKEKCLAAGMSDYISKPVQVSQLLSLMRVWLYK